MVFSKDPLTKKNGRIVLLTKKIRDSGLPKVLMSKSRNLLDRTEEWKLFQLWPLIWEWHWIVDIQVAYLLSLSQLLRGRMVMLMVSW